MIVVTNFDVLFPTPCVISRITGNQLIFIRGKEPVLNKVLTGRPQRVGIARFEVNSLCCRCLYGREDEDIIKNQIGFGIDL